MNTKVTHWVPGNQGSVELHLPDHACEVQCAAPATNRPLRELVRSALEHPLEFPDLSLAILDDDQVAIAIESGLPRAPEVAEELVQWLLAKNLRPEQITVVLSATDDASHRAMKQGLAAFEGLRILPHTPNDAQQLEYVAAAESADAIYIQRDLVEASVVIPVYCIRHPQALGASDLYGISPAFADAKTQQRWNLAWLADSDHHFHLQAKLSREAGWLMGIQFAMAVVPAAEGEIAGIVGGSPPAVFEHATSQLEAASSLDDLRGQHDLVIACIDGGPDQQTWTNVARAIDKSEPLLTPAGCVAVCCELNRVTDGIAQLASDEPDEQVERDLLRGTLEDAFAAAVIRSAQGKRSIYFLSSLGAADIEGLGLAHVSGPEGIDKLAQRARSVCLLRTSQF